MSTRDVRRAALALTEAAWVRCVGDTLGWTGEIVEVAAEDLPPEPDPAPLDWRQDLVMDPTRIRRALGYEERVEFGEGVRRAAVWEAEQADVTARCAVQDPNERSTG